MNEPNAYRAVLTDGPLDGVSFDVPSCPDKLLLILDDETRIRYETWRQSLTEENGQTVDVCEMVVSRDLESFDEELLA